MRARGSCRRRRCWSARATPPRACGPRCRSKGLRERTFLGPPGVDVHTFVPRDKAAATQELDALVRWLDSAERTGFGPAAAEANRRALPPAPRQAARARDELAEVRAGYDVTGIDVGAPGRPGRARSASASRSCAYVGQADRLEGRRPAARRLAAGAGARAARKARDRRLRDLPRRHRGAAARARARRRAAADARVPPGPGAGGRPARPAHLPAHVPRGHLPAATSATSPRQRRCARASCSPAASTTASSRACCRARRRSSCRACSPRRSAWWPRRAPPAACCRSAPRTRASPRSPRSSARSSRPRCGSC